MCIFRQRLERGLRTEYGIHSKIIDSIVFMIARSAEDRSQIQTIGSQLLYIIERLAYPFYIAAVKSVF